VSRSIPVRRRRIVVLRAIAALAIAFGYADLVRGGTLFAPLALVVGYLVLVPLSLLAE
jgi:hypothetical protein